MAIDVNKLRADHAEFRNLQDSVVNYGTWMAHPVVDWGRHRYIVVGTIRLMTGRQRLTVIDVTDVPIALFSMMWPDQGDRHSALVLHVDEGHDGVLLETGVDRWVRYADLTIVVHPGSTDECRATADEMDDELQTHVDEGGGLF